MPDRQRDELSLVGGRDAMAGSSLLILDLSGEEGVRAI